jgi:hypothetical protein
MAKRRNLKKEKALRNQAYARKFRKRTNTGRMGRRRSPNSGSNSSSDDNDDQESSDDGDSNQVHQGSQRGMR